MSNVWARSGGRFCGRMSGQVWGSVKREIINPQTETVKRRNCGRFSVGISGEVFKGSIISP